MKSLCLWLFGALLLGPPGSLWAQQLADVTFQVDLNVGIESGQFNPDEDRVLLRGEFNDWGMEAKMADLNGTGVFTITLPLEAGNYGYKFFIDGGLNVPNDGWEAGEDRVLEVAESQVLNPVFFRTEFDTVSVESDGYVHLFAHSPYIEPGKTTTEFDLGILSSSDSLVHALEFDLRLLSDNGMITRVEVTPQALDAGWELRYHKSDEDSSLRVACAGTNPVASGNKLATVEVEGINPWSVPEPVMLEISELIVNEDFSGSLNITEGTVFVFPVEQPEDSLDLTGDQKVDGEDVFYLSELMVKDRHNPVSDEMKARTDLTQDGTLSMLDAYLFNQWVMYGIDISGFIPLQPIAPEITFEGNAEDDSVTFSISMGNVPNLKALRLYASLSSAHITDGLYPFADYEGFGMVTFLEDVEANPMYDVGMMRIPVPAEQKEVFSLNFKGSLADFTNVAAGFSNEFLVIDSLQVNEQPVTVLGDTLRFDQFVVSVDEDDNLTTMPEKAALRQNYPNPFNPNTQISVELAEAQHIRLEVFTMLGERVSVLENKQLSAGNHTFTFDADRLSSGIYLYRLTTLETVQTRKMILIK